MESYPLPAFGVEVHAALFTPITCAAELRQRLVTASTLPQDAQGDAERAQLDFAFIDASMLASRMHLLSAITQALVSQSDGALKTKTIHSEVLWRLEPGSNISDSLKHFGLSVSTASLVLVRIAPFGFSTRATILNHMTQLVHQATPHSLDLLGDLPNDGTNIKSLRKVYKLDNDVVLKAADASKSAIQLRQTIDKLCTSAVALKSAA
ncbi:hypothetical protein OIO90_001125 [Microbotryomycetes sp. JL221]|nr:hypothetical protein OIO90_001125 [Microbotryomycetes sp. JL221]